MFRIVFNGFASYRKRLIWFNSVQFIYSLANFDTDLLVILLKIKFKINVIHYLPTNLLCNIIKLVRLITKNAIVLAELFINCKIFTRITLNRQFSAKMTINKDRKKLKKQEKMDKSSIKTKILVGQNLGSDSQKFF
jgi:hypothetical protein